MASDVGESFVLLDTVLAGEESSAFTREEVLDGLAFLALDATLSTGELPTDPILIRCLEDWRSRVLSATSDEPNLEFTARIERYFELRPLNPRVMAALETHFDRQGAKQENRTRSRANKL